MLKSFFTLKHFYSYSVFFVNILSFEKILGSVHDKTARVPRAWQAELEVDL